jgi:RHS repeat-associated protein
MDAIADKDNPSALSLQPSSRTEASVPVYYYYHWDHLGTTRLITNQSGGAVSRHDYEPFGVEIPPTNDTASNTHQYTGHERDKNTGYDYMHFRYYGSNIGRFMKPDKIGGQAGDPQSWNKYVYCGSNPINSYDPDGLFHKVDHKLIAFAALAQYDTSAKMHEAIEKGSIEPDVGFLGLGVLRLGQHFDMNPDPNVDSRDVLADQKIAQGRQLELQGGDQNKLMAVGLYSQASHYIADKWGHRVANGTDAQGNTIFRDVGPAEHALRSVIGFIQKLLFGKDTFSPDSKDEASFDERKKKAAEEEEAKLPQPTEQSDIVLKEEECE